MLQISNLSISLPDGKKVVEGLSLEIQPDAVSVLVGPNGSGKSTLALAMAGHPGYQIGTASQLIMDGLDLIALSPDERAKAGLFLGFQQPVAIAGISVLQLIKVMTDHLRIEKLEVKKLKLKIQQYAQLLGIKDELLGRSVNEGFSGGERKRIEMLQLLMAKPKYAILDEIDSGLDVDAIKLMADAINYTKKEFGTGFVVVTHHQRLLTLLKPTKVWVLAMGRVVKTGGMEVITEIDKSGFQQISP